MKTLVLILVSVVTLVGCSSIYTFEKGEQKAEILVEAQNLRRVGRMRDDTAIIELYENNDKLGTYLVSVQANSKLIEVPANKLTSIVTIQYVVKFGATTECIIPVKISPKPNEQYKLVLGYSQWKSSCTTILSLHNGDKYVSLSQIGAKDKGARIKLIER